MMMATILERLLILDTVQFCEDWLGVLCYCEGTSKFWTLGVMFFVACHWLALWDKEYCVMTRMDTSLAFLSWPMLTPFPKQWRKVSMVNNPARGWFILPVLTVVSLILGKLGGAAWQFLIHVEMWLFHGVFHDPSLWIPTQISILVRIKRFDDPRWCCGCVCCLLSLLLLLLSVAISHSLVSLYILV